MRFEYRGVSGKCCDAFAIVVDGVVDSKVMKAAQHINHATDSALWFAEQNYRQYGGMQYQILCRQEMRMIHLIDRIGGAESLSMRKIGLDCEYCQIIFVAVGPVSFAIS